MIADADGEELNIYDDLDEFQQVEDKKSKETTVWQQKYNDLQTEVDSVRAENKALLKRVKVMEVNLQNLLDTAKSEIQRKDSMIAQLRKEKDDICFRRKLVPNFKQSQKDLTKGDPKKLTSGLSEDMSRHRGNSSDFRPADRPEVCHERSPKLHSHASNDKTRAGRSDRKRSRSREKDTNCAKLEKQGVSKTVSQNDSSHHGKRPRSRSPSRSHHKRARADQLKPASTKKIKTNSAIDSSVSKSRHDANKLSAEATIIMDNKQHTPKSESNALQNTSSPSKNCCNDLVNNAHEAKSQQRKESLSTFEDQSLLTATKCNFRNALESSEIPNLDLIDDTQHLETLEPMHHISYKVLKETLDMVRNTLDTKAELEVLGDNKKPKDKNIDNFTENEKNISSTDKSKNLQSGEQCTEKKLEALVTISNDVKAKKVGMIKNISDTESILMPNMGKELIGIPIGKDFRIPKLLKENEVFAVVSHTAAENSKVENQDTDRIKEIAGKQLTQEEISTVLYKNMELTPIKEIENACVSLELTPIKEIESPDVSSNKICTYKICKSGHPPKQTSQNCELVAEHSKISEGDKEIQNLVNEDVKLTSDTLINVKSNSPSKSDLNEIERENEKINFLHSSPENNRTKELLNPNEKEHISSKDIHIIEYLRLPEKLNIEKIATHVDKSQRQKDIKMRKKCNKLVEDNSVKIESAAKNLVSGDQVKSEVASTGKTFAKVNEHENEHNLFDKNAKCLKSTTDKEPPQIVNCQPTTKAMGKKSIQNKNALNTEKKLSEQVLHDHKSIQIAKEQAIENIKVSLEESFKTSNDNILKKAIAESGKSAEAEALMNGEIAKDIYPVQTMKEDISYQSNLIEDDSMGSKSVSHEQVKAKKCSLIGMRSKEKKKKRKLTKDVSGTKLEPSAITKHKVSVLYAQPDSTESDQPEDRAIERELALCSTPVKVSSLGMDFIDVALQQLHQQPLREDAADEGAVTSSSMNLMSHTPRRDLMKALTQSPKTNLIQVLSQSCTSAAKEDKQLTAEDKIKDPSVGTVCVKESLTNPIHKCDMAPLKKRKLNLNDSNHKCNDEFASDNEVSVPPLMPINDHATQQLNESGSMNDLTVDESFESKNSDDKSSVSLNMTNNASILAGVVTKRCSLGNSDYDFERTNDGIIILRVKRHEKKRKEAQPLNTSSVNLK